MKELNLKEMLEAGVHFGHKTDKWNPKMAPFIFTQRNGVHIFDLAKTKEKLSEAGKYAAEVAREGGSILFVGTKNQTKDVIKKAAREADMPYLTDRWPGGMLTNFPTILKRLKYMKEAEDRSTSGIGLTKKELLNVKRELEKLNTVFEGVADTRALPKALFVADIVKEKTAVREAKKLGIPIIGIADSNAVPDVDYVIPANDDAVGSVRYIVEYISECIKENKGQKKEDEESADMKDENQPKDSNDKDDKKEETVKDESEEKIDKIEMEAAEKAVTKKQKPKEDVKEDK